MTILIIGKGGRESAIARSLGSSAIQKDFNTVEEAVNFCLKNRHDIDIVLPGGEKLIAAGITDALETIGIACCAPNKEAAQLETSKIFCRDLCYVAKIPIPTYRVVHNVKRNINIEGDLPVIKLDGLSGGKGVYLPDTEEEAKNCIRNLLKDKKATKGGLLLEERLYGWEASFFYAVNMSQHYCLISTAKDYKRLEEGNKGPNTGGMGSISPHPDIKQAHIDKVNEKVIKPLMCELNKRKIRFHGFLYAGIMFDEDDNPYLIEFNIRLGDPETQAMLGTIPKDCFVKIVEAIVSRNYTSLMRDVTLVMNKRVSTSACAIVLRSLGYPNNDLPLGKVESSIEDTDELWVDYAAANSNNGFEGSGRLLAVVACGDTSSAAVSRAQTGIAKLKSVSTEYRKDIGYI